MKQERKLSHRDPVLAHLANTFQDSQVLLAKTVFLLFYFFVCLCSLLANTVFLLFIFCLFVFFAWQKDFLIFLFLLFVCVLCLATQSSYFLYFFVCLCSLLANKIFSLFTFLFYFFVCVIHKEQRDSIP